MSPDPIKMLTCILENLEELVFPRVADEHAVSVARCTSVLIRHLMLRLESEPNLLAEDSREKRILFSEIARNLADAPSGALVRHAETLAAAAAETALVPVSLNDLTEENNRLRDRLEQFLYVFHGERPVLNEYTYSNMSADIRRQLRAQTDRDATLVLEPLAGTNGMPY